MTTTSDKILLTVGTKIKETSTGEIYTVVSDNIDNFRNLEVVAGSFRMRHTFNGNVTSGYNDVIISQAALLAEIAVGTYHIVLDTATHPITSAIEAAKRMRHNLDNIINDLETIAILGHHATKNSFYVSDNAKLVASNLNTRICDWYDEVNDDNIVIAEYIEFTSKF